LADLKLVGAVAIKVRPDARGFRGDAQRAINKELAGVEATVKIKIEADTTAVKVDVEKAKKEAERTKITLNVGLDYDSVRAGMKQLEALLKKKIEIPVDLKDAASIAKAQADLAAMAKDANVEITFSPDEVGYREVLAKIDAIRRQKLEKTIEFKTDEASLSREEAKYKALLEASKPVMKVDISYNQDRAGLEKAIAEIDAELAKVGAVKISVNLNPLELAFAKARLEEELGTLTVRIDYDDNEAGLRVAKARIEELLHIDHKIHIETTLDEAALREQLAIVDAKIKAAEQNKLKIKPEIAQSDFLVTLAAIKLLTKNQTVNIFAKMNDSSLVLAAAKLTGLRAASRWAQEFAESIGTLDRNLPIVAAAVLGVSQLSSSIVSLTSDAFSLGNGLGEVVRMAAVMAPAMLLGLGAVMVVMKGVFKDFGAAVNGDTKALERLSPAGRKAAEEIKPVFASIRELVSANFWDKASDGMLRFVETALPAVGSGLGQLSGSLGGVFSSLLDSFTKLTKQDGVKVFFDNLSHGFDVAQTGLSSFMDGFLALAVAGSTAFPEIGRAFNDMSAKFSTWAAKIAADGTLHRWVADGVQGMKDLFGAGVSLINVWGNIGQAAQAAGALTLHSFADALAKLDAVTSGPRFQKNMKAIFEGAGQASDIFFKSLGSLGPAMDTFSVTVKNTLVGSAHALAALVADIGDVFSSPLVGVGLTAFLTGLQSMFIALRPAAASVATILQTVGQVLGQVATDSGPLFQNLFQQLAGVLTVAWSALAPFLPGLIQFGTTVVNILGPALGAVAGTVIPAFASGIQKIGDGLVPVIRFMAAFAAVAVTMVTSLPLPNLAAMAGFILSLGTAFKFASTVVPLAAAALEAFGVTAAISAVRVQLMVPVVGIVLAALTGLIAFGITALATSQHAAAPYASEYAAALQEDAKAAGAVAGAVGLATTKVAINKLVTSGAYDAAKKLGIGNKEVTDAIVKGGSAWDDLQKKISGAISTYDDAQAAAAKAVSAQQQFAGDTPSGAPTAAMADQAGAAKKLRDALNDNKDSLDAMQIANEANAEASKAAGIQTDAQATSQRALAAQSGLTAQALGAAAQASATLSDTFSSSQSKIDAMRKTFEILLGTNAAQAAAETLGAYVKGFNDIKDSVIPVAGEMRNLGDAAFGANGFLNVASGNKAVLQVNQALVDEVNNVWAGAKAAYDAAIKQGDTATGAFQKAQAFINDHKGDYNALAVASGVSADMVQGQWDAVFGHDWVLKVTLDGATEAAARAQNLVTVLKGTFDGKDFVAYLDANPDKAMEAIQNPVQAATDYVNHTWDATLGALPEPAQATITALLNQTDKTWVAGDFTSILRVADGVPGLAEAVIQIRNGAAVDYVALIKAVADGTSIEVARAALDAAAYDRTVMFKAIVDRSQLSDLNGDVSGNGRFGTNADGGLFQTVRQFSDLFKGQFPAGVKSFANGGVENHTAGLFRPSSVLRFFAEPETGGEAYIPLAASKRPRSLSILGEVAKKFGFELTRATSLANGTPGGSTVPTRTTNTSVTVGTINTVDPESAIRKLRALQRDALSLEGIH